MRQFRGSGKDAEELRETRRELEDAEARLREARDTIAARDREIRELKATVRRLEIRLADMKTGGEFVESHGVLWHRSAAGGIEPLAHCPTCRLVLTPMPSGYPEYFVCTRCSFRAPFHPEAVPAIMDELTPGG